MIFNAVSMGRARSIAALPLPVQAMSCAAMALLCDRCGLFHTDTNVPAALWRGVPICHTGGVEWLPGFRDGLSMGAAMMLVSLVPLRWTGVVSLAGGVTALLWVMGAGVLDTLIVATDQIAPMTGGALPSPVPRLILLAVSMAAALHAPGRTSRRGEHTTFRDGAHCFLRCGPMMIAMMLTGMMSMPGVIASALLTKLDESIGDRRLSCLLTCGIGVVATVATLATS